MANGPLRGNAVLIEVDKMMTLPDPRKTACATARVIASRARAIADLGLQIADFNDPTQISPEEWAVMNDALAKLIEELREEADNFYSLARFAM
jgi:DNA-directed RNA polymerase subunit K/omega